VNFERFTHRRLPYFPGNVKLWESPGKAGGLPMIINLFLNCFGDSGGDEKWLTKLIFSKLSDYRLAFRRGQPANICHSINILNVRKLGGINGNDSVRVNFT